MSLPQCPFTILCRNLAGAALRHLAALLAGASLALLMVQVYGLYHPFAAALFYAAAVNCRPTGLHPAAPLLSALAYHVSPCFNLLYGTFYIFF